MPIHMYEEWLKESEKVDPVSAIPPTDPQTTTPTEVDVPLEVGTETPESPEEGPLPEKEEFERIDTARRAAITAFKEKQQEYMEMPEEVRNNPTSDEDKTKVESLKAELKTLNDAMKAAVAEYDAFNDKMLGSSGDAQAEP